MSKLTKMTDFQILVKIKNTDILVKFLLIFIFHFYLKFLQLKIQRKNRNKKVSIIH